MRQCAIYVQSIYNKGALMQAVIFMIANNQHYVLQVP